MNGSASSYINSKFTTMTMTIISSSIMINGINAIAITITLTMNINIIMNNTNTNTNTMIISFISIISSSSSSTRRGTRSSITVARLFSFWYVRASSRISFAVLSRASSGSWCIATTITNIRYLTNYYYCY